MFTTRRRWELALVTALFLPTLFSPSPVAARQQALSFDSEFPLTVILDDTTPVQRFDFHCTRNQVASVYVETVGGNLAVAVSLLDPIGSPFAQGLQVSGSPNITIAEAVIIPASGNCALKISRSGNTSGSVQLRLLSGYAHLARWDSFDTVISPQRMTWTDFTNLDMDVRIVPDQRLRLQIFYDNVFAYITPDDPDFNLNDLYIQADFTIDGAPSYFEYGFLIRSNADASSFYTVTFSSEGDYSIYYFNHDWTTVQPWTASPLIDGSDHHPHVGVWVQGNMFRLYFGDQLAGETVDSKRFASQGTIGFAAATTAHQTGALTVYVDNAVITTPFRGQ
jgi:hypothetical protein